MTGVSDIDSTFEEQKRQYVMDFLREKELISSKDNVIYVDKGFTVNAVLKWCLDSASIKAISKKQWDKHKTIVAKYIAGLIEIKWVDNGFEAIEVKYDSEKEKKSIKQRRKPRSTKK